MRKLLTFIAAVIAILSLSSFSYVTDEDIIAQGYSYEQLDTLKADIVDGRIGTIPFSVCHSSLTVPSGFVFLNKEQTSHLIVDYWNNPKDRMDNVVGALVPSNINYFYQISTAYIISYDNSGYVPDDDANDIDYDDLLKTIQEQEKEENKSLPTDQQSTTIGWARTPKYIYDRHVLVWAKTLSFQYGNTVNYDMRILGKNGLVSINAVVDPEECEEVVSLESTIISSLKYDNGYTYNDFDASSDKVSEWTVGSLVAGGILAKSGVLAKIGVLLLKCWKLIAIGIVAVGAGIRKYFKSKNNINLEK